MPLVGSAPLQPPEAAHEVALLELHVKVAAPPEATLVGFAVNVAVGTELTATVVAATARVPADPIQVSENVVSAIRAPVPLEPLVVNAPLHPPEALQEVAFVELHVNVDSLPPAIADGDALSDAVGCELVNGLAVSPQAANDSAVPINKT